MIIPFIIGLILLTAAILFHRLGTKRPGPQTFWLFAGALGVGIVIFTGIKILNFRESLRINEDDTGGPSSELDENKKE